MDQGARMRSLLTAIVPVIDYSRAREETTKLKGQVDAFELRLDYLDKLDTNSISDLMSHINKPLILTVRSQKHGGVFAHSEQQRLRCIEQCMRLEPSFIDVESDVTDNFIANLHTISPKTKIIRSVHHFLDTPENLDDLLQSMLHPSVSIYKVITTAKHSLDALRMLSWVQLKSRHHQIIGHCMGEAGYPSRIAGACCGNYFTYAALSNKVRVLDHTISVHDFNTIYHIREKNKATKLYALIGDPIDRSQGHLFHNNYFHQQKINALYFKLKITAAQLATLFDYVQSLPFAGLSVTMPLKQQILNQLVNQDAMNAVNTLTITEKRIIANNTDGLGALDAIEETMKVANKHLLVIGAGGAACAIIDEAIQRGAHLCIVNRSADKAQKLAQHYKVQCLSFDEPPHQHVDIVVNTLPDKAYQNERLVTWLSGLLQTLPLVLDINYNQKHSLLQHSIQNYRCTTIAGEKMFIKQAFAQLKLWGLDKN
jgi:3-dehydroquinate dehydratase/shikimate dehydrogenase